MDIDYKSEYIYTEDLNSQIEQTTDPKSWLNIVRECMDGCYELYLNSYTCDIREQERIINCLYLRKIRRVHPEIVGWAIHNHFTKLSNYFIEMFRVLDTSEYSHAERNVSEKLTANGLGPLIQYTMPKVIDEYINNVPNAEKVSKWWLWYYHKGPDWAVNYSLIPQFYENIQISLDRGLIVEDNSTLIGLFKRRQRSINSAFILVSALRACFDNVLYDIRFSIFPLIPGILRFI